MRSVEIALLGATLFAIGIVSAIAYLQRLKNLTDRDH